MKINAREKRVLREMSKRGYKLSDADKVEAVLGLRKNKQEKRRPKIEQQKRREKKYRKELIDKGTRAEKQFYYKDKKRRKAVYGEGGRREYEDTRQLKEVIARNKRGMKSKHLRRTHRAFRRMNKATKALGPLGLGLIGIEKAVEYLKGNKKKGKKL